MEQAIDGTSQVANPYGKSFYPEKNIYPYKVYAELCCIRFVLDMIGPGHSFSIKIVDLLNNGPLAQEKEMGFPAQWSEGKIFGRYEIEIQIARTLLSVSNGAGALTITLKLPP